MAKDAFPPIDTPRIVFPTIPADDPRFVWNPHGDVQATWRRFGWVPPSELKPAIPDQNVGSCKTSQL